MRVTRCFLAHVLCSFLLLPWATTSSARSLHWFGEVEDIELATWPPYCKARASAFEEKNSTIRLVSTTEKERWQRYFGQTFQHLHHYCKGLLWQLRAGRPSWIARHNYPLSFILGQVPAEFYYTWTKLPPTHRMYGKMGADLLLAYQDAGDPDAAKRIMNDLLSVKPHDRYTYTGAADFYRKQGNRNKAIEMLEQSAGKVRKNGAILADLAQDYYDLKEYEKSREYARLARSKGLKLVRLGKELEKVGFPITGK